MSLIIVACLRLPSLPHPCEGWGLFTAFVRLLTAAIYESTFPPTPRCLFGFVGGCDAVQFRRPTQIHLAIHDRGRRTKIAFGIFQRVGGKLLEGLTEFDHKTDPLAVEEIHAVACYDRRTVVLAAPRRPATATIGSTRRGLQTLLINALTRFRFDTIDHATGNPIQSALIEDWRRDPSTVAFMPDHMGIIHVAFTAGTHRNGVSVATIHRVNH